VVERWIAPARVRKDLWGWADLAVIDPHLFGTLYVQVCAGGDHARRKQKLLALSTLEAVCSAGNRAAILSWSRRGPRGKRKVWTPRLEML
jgi:hypothetical protein